MRITNTSQQEKDKLLKLFNSAGGKLSSPIRNNRFRKFEDELLLKNFRRVIIYGENDTDFVKFSSFAFVNLKHNIDVVRLIEKLWHKRKCKRCKNVDNIVFRRAMPVGNLKPKYMFIGEAPAVADGKRPLERVMSYGPSSLMLRKALIKKRLYIDSWFTNIMKCAFKDNKAVNDDQYFYCANFIFVELRLLRPEKIIALGNKVANFLPKIGINNFVKMKHPSYYIYSKKTWEDYADDINI